MIKVENIKVFNLEGAIRGMRNPMNSWDKLDTDFSKENVTLGENDKNLAQRLIKAGSEHRKFLRQIVIGFDVVAPTYWYLEFDTYKVGVISNSCSKMHKLMSRHLTIDDFSLDCTPEDCAEDKPMWYHPMWYLLEMLNKGIDIYNNFDEYKQKGKLRESFTDKKQVFLTVLQMLPMSYNQRRTVTMNAENLLNIVNQRSHHKLKEWHDFIDAMRDGTPELSFLWDLVNNTKTKCE